MSALAFTRYARLLDRLRLQRGQPIDMRTERDLLGQMEDLYWELGATERELVEELGFRAWPDAYLNLVGIPTDRDDEDLEREPFLAAALLRPQITGEAGSLIDPHLADVLKVHLDTSDGGRIFACVVVTPERFFLMHIEDHGHLATAEGFSLQVNTDNDLNAALKEWATREFPKQPTPEFSIRMYEGP